MVRAHHAHDPGLVILSIVLAFFGASAALMLMKQRTGGIGLRNRLILILSAACLAVTGIFCMHFVGMYALHVSSGGVQLPIHFKVLETAMSAIAPFIGTAVAFSLAGDPDKFTYIRLAIGALLVGASVCVMVGLDHAFRLFSHFVGAALCRHVFVGSHRSTDSVQLWSCRSQLHHCCCCFIGGVVDLFPSSPPVGRK